MAAVVAICLVAGWLAAITSTHAALSGGLVGWSDVVPGHTAGLTRPTSAEQAQIGFTPDDGQTNYSQILWVTHPGGEISFGFDVHNGGLAPVTVLSLALRTFGPDVITVLAPAGAQLGPGFGQMVPFHAVTIGPGGSVAVGLTERVICDPLMRRDGRLPSSNDSSGSFAEPTSPVILRYRVLGVIMSQTVAVSMPMLVVLPYQSCR